MFKRTGPWLPAACLCGAMHLTCHTISQAEVIPLRPSMGTHPSAALTRPQLPQRVDTARTALIFENASPAVRTTVHWVKQTEDHQGSAFVVVDKIHARIYVFSGQGRLLGADAVLLGWARGDQSVPGIGERPLQQIRPSERTTPAGRFVAAWGHNLADQEILWVDYEQGISLHPVRQANPQERRLERLASPSVSDNRISYGCINVGLGFWQQVVKPTFKGKQAMVYVLPEEQDVDTVLSQWHQTR